MMPVNAPGTFLGLRAALPLMQSGGGGAVVNVASTAGILGLPGLGPNVASKYAVVGLTGAAAAEAARHAIRVNAVCLGPTEARMIASIERGAKPDDPFRARAGYETAFPLRRYARPRGGRARHRLLGVARSVLRHRGHRSGRRRDVGGVSPRMGRVSPPICL